IVDTGSWYVHHCPTGQIRKVRATGGIYRVRPAHWQPDPDPWGLGVGWSDQNPYRLARLLTSPRPAVRDSAQRRLTALGKSAARALPKAFDFTPDLRARQHAVWALAGIPDDAAAAALRSWLDTNDADLLITTARA